MAGENTDKHCSHLCSAGEIGGKDPAPVYFLVDLVASIIVTTCGVPEH